IKCFVCSWLWVLLVRDSHHSLDSTVDVKLDPNTAHKRLALSEDGKEVGDSGEDQEISDSPGRFDLFGSVLGLNGFSSGRSYWEVEVGNKTGWDLGVATGGASRKGKLTLSPENGYWVLVHYEEEKYAAMASVPLSLFLKEKPTRVGLFVDYKEGLVSFYDVRAHTCFLYVQWFLAILWFTSSGLAVLCIFQSALGSVSLLVVDNCEIISSVLTPVETAKFT
uniref:B30.2/SPRY domain-containing protein n=1 Tax=Oryzias melastigma TaxID=30732 RepID=A0A3B3DTB9_ORYME